MVLPPWALFANTNIGGEPLLACHQQGRYRFLSFYEVSLWPIWMNLIDMSSSRSDLYHNIIKKIIIINSII